MSGKKTRSDWRGRRVLDVVRKLSRAVVRAGSTLWNRIRDAAPPEVGPTSGRTDPRARERGAVTAEYAIAMLAAVGFAGLLVVILRGDEVRGMLTDLIRNALSAQ
ncbi:MAG: DUF4244 domain-containing protein [Microbacteriaceae bacterium]|nr:DUF4244 domain-containing protein [Microbacteriaceae bacterium]MCI1207661.1 DUF4244 domain-containing protein [Microbacteriaceae bacterium]